MVVKARCVVSFGVLGKRRYPVKYHLAAESMGINKHGKATAVPYGHDLPDNVKHL